MSPATAAMPGTGAGTLFEIRSLRQSYGERTVLAVDRLDIARASITAITGPNGSGKSTLMRLLAFLEEPTSGEIVFRTGNGDSSPRRQVTLLLQSPYILKRSVFRNVAHGLRIRGETERLGERVTEAMEMVGLDPAEYGERTWFELSGGEAQRVSLASRLILRPQALLLDEPTSSLDEASAVLIQAAALKARETWGTTIVVASHDRAWLSEVADREFTLKTPHSQPGDGICGPSA